VTYEILGPEGAVATINYLDLDAQPQEVKHATCAALGSRRKL